MPDILLIDANERVTGRCDEREAHDPPGYLHIGISVLLVDVRSGELMVQRRAEDESGFAGRWSNSCSGHPLPEEPLEDAARRCGQSQLGTSLSDLEPGGGFLFRAVDGDTGFVEFEKNHVFVGSADSALVRSSAGARVDWLEGGDVSSMLRDFRSVTPWLALALATAARSSRRFQNLVELSPLAFSHPDLVYVNWSVRYSM